MAYEIINILLQLLQYANFYKNSSFELGNTNIILRALLLRTSLSFKVRKSLPDLLKYNEGPKNIA